MIVEMKFEMGMLVWVVWNGFMRLCVNYYEGI